MGCCTCSQPPQPQRGALPQRGAHPLPKFGLTQLCQPHQSSLTLTLSACYSAGFENSVPSGADGLCAFSHCALKLQCFRNSSPKPGEALPFCFSPISPCLMEELCCLREHHVWAGGAGVL